MWVGMGFGWNGQVPFGALLLQGGYTNDDNLVFIGRVAYDGASLVGPIKYSKLYLSMLRILLTTIKNRFNQIKGIVQRPTLGKKYWKNNMKCLSLSIYPFESFLILTIFEEKLYKCKSIALRWNGNNKSIQHPHT